MSRVNRSKWPLRISFLVLVFVSFATVAESAGFLNQPARDNQLWNCNFDKNACHFRNQYNLARFSRYYNPAKPFHGERSVLVLDLATSNARKFPGGRLISHYFPAKYTNACLYVNYLMVGNGPRAFYIIQQDKENKCIYADENSQRSTGWRQKQLQLDLTDGDPRFFIEAQYDSRPNPADQAQYDSNSPGYIALSLFSFAFGECERNDANNCFSDMEHNSADDQTPQRPAEQPQQPQGPEVFPPKAE